MPPAPASICLLRLSALGDATHVLPLVHTLRAVWPDVDIAWVIGKGEHRLLQGLPGVRFVEYDKKTGLRGMRALRREPGDHAGAACNIEHSLAGLQLRESNQHLSDRAADHGDEVALVILRHTPGKRVIEMLCHRISL